MESPAQKLSNFANKFNCHQDSRAFADQMDKRDQLADFRNKFVFPTLADFPRNTEGDPESTCIYLCGNSLGLKPKSADVHMAEQLENWGKWAAFMHFHGSLPAASADLPGLSAMSRIVGAEPAEVALMNGLTVNQHLLMVGFYKPTPSRYKILIEDHAFPSDRYAMRSQLRMRGYGEDALLLVKPRKGEETIRTQDILDIIKQEGKAIAVVMLSGIQYYTGQRFDIPTITAAGHAAGCMVGWDLAHAAGNVELRLHDWDVDFAVWCTYKYLNSGAGGIGGAFVHSRHHGNMPDHLEGWWSNAQDTRFEMRDMIDPAVGAASFRLSNPPPWLTSLNKASLEIFEAAGMEKIMEKRDLLTGYLEILLDKRLGDKMRIITPRHHKERGAQLSLVFYKDLHSVHDYIERRGVLCDVRSDTIRVAPAPLYNSFADVWNFVNILEKALLE